MSPDPVARRRPIRLAGPAVALALAAGLALAGCDAGPEVTPPIVPGTPDHPRPVVLIFKDYEYVPKVVDLVPGETVLIQAIDGGTLVHEAVIGPQAVQDAWEAAEGPTVSAPPGPTPAISVPPGMEGIRIVLRSGERRDYLWTVPLDIAGSGSAAWLIGCHIPGHWERGMVAAIRLVEPGSSPTGTFGPSGS